MNQETPPEVWHFRVSHYNEKVRWALDFKQWTHRRHSMIAGWHIPVARWLSGQNSLPIARIEGRVLAGSNHILEEIERLRPEPPLLPTCPKERTRALEVQAWFDEEVAPDMRRLFWSHYLRNSAACARMACDGFNPFVRAVWQISFPLVRPLFVANMGLNPEQIEKANRKMRGYLNRLTGMIQPSGYLVGETFSVADLTAAAVMTAILRPPGFSYPLPDPWPGTLIQMRSEIENHPASRWVMDIYTKHRGQGFGID